MGIRGVEQYQKPPGAATPSAPLLSPILKPFNEMRERSGSRGAAARHYYNEQRVGPLVAPEPAPLPMENRNQFKVSMSAAHALQNISPIDPKKHHDVHRNAKTSRATFAA